MGTRYGTFLDSYNSGNHFMDKMIQNFLERITFDLKMLAESSNEYISGKSTKMTMIIGDPLKNNQEKLFEVIAQLKDLSVNSFEDGNKKNIANIIYALMDLAKSSEDSMLIEQSLNIANQIPGLM